MLSLAIMTPPLNFKPTTDPPAQIGYLKE